MILEAFTANSFTRARFIRAVAVRKVNFCVGALLHDMGLPNYVFQVLPIVVLELQKIQQRVSCRSSLVGSVLQGTKTMGE